MQQQQQQVKSESKLMGSPVLNKPLSKKKVLVFNGTSKQGSSVIDSLLRDRDNWLIRTTCRDPTTPAARSLAFRDVELTAVNWDSPDVEKTLEKAMEGVHAVFAVTLPPFYGLKRSELEQGQLIANAAKKCKVAHFIFSSLPNVQRESKGELNVKHFTDKALVADFIKTMDFKYTAFVMPGMYYQMFQNVLKPVEENGELVFKIPQVGTLWCFDVRDIGETVKNILYDAERWNGMELPICGEHAAPHDFVQTFNKITGRNASLRFVDLDELSRRGPNGASMAEMFRWINNCGYYGQRDWKLGKQVFRGLHNWESFVKENFSNTDQKTEQTPMENVH